MRILKDRTEYRILIYGKYLVRVENEIALDFTPEKPHKKRRASRGKKKTPAGGVR